MTEKLKKTLRQYIAKTETDETERTVTAIINTDTIDRDHEIILPKGMDAIAYLKNPVVLWAHDYSQPPIARALWLKKGRNRITAKMQFAEDDVAERVYQLYKNGFLSAFSVGIVPTEQPRPPKPEEIKAHPEWSEARYIYPKWELLEFSAVPVPANPDALAQAIKVASITIEDAKFAGFDVEAIEADEEETLMMATKTPSQPEPEVEAEPHPELTTIKVAPVAIKVQPVSDIRVAEPITVAPATDELVGEAIKRHRGVMY
ncbi:MAG: HK97 family phage prohead protease [Gemmatimonadales bacterium]|nr:HK97 family phage prohead protease [Gemmatimonadales bacterium]